MEKDKKKTLTISSNLKKKLIQVSIKRWKKIFFSRKKKNLKKLKTI